MRAASGRNEFDLLELLRIDHEDAVALHVRYEEEFSVRRNSNVLRHAVRRGQLQLRDDLSPCEIDLDHAATGKLTREKCIRIVDREVRMIHADTLWCRDVVLEFHRLWVTKFELLQCLGDHDRGLAIGCEVQVVSVRDFDRRAWLAGLRIDWRQYPGQLSLGAPRDPKRFQIP